MSRPPAIFLKVMNFRLRNAQDECLSWTLIASSLQSAKEIRQCADYGRGVVHVEGVADAVEAGDLHVGTCSLDLTNILV